MATVISTPEGINRFVIITLKQALKLYDKTGMKANRAYTPKNMRLKTEQLTGKKFAARDYKGMIAALEELLGD